MENRSKSVLGAMLADDDISLEPSWPKMTSRTDFFIDSGYIWGTKNASKIYLKMKLFADVSRNLVFFRMELTNNQNEGPKQLQKLVFSGKG